MTVTKMTSLDEFSKVDHMVNANLDELVRRNEKRGGFYGMFTWDDDVDSGDGYKFATLDEAVSAAHIAAYLLGLTAVVYVCFGGVHHKLHVYDSVVDTREGSENHM